MAKTTPEQEEPEQEHPPKAVLKRIARNLVLYRAGAEMQRDDLAEASGVDESHLGKIERVEVKNISLQTLSKLATALKIDIVDLLLAKKVSSDGEK